MNGRSVGFLGVGTELDTILLRYDQSDFQDIDGIEAKPLAVQRRVRIDVLGGDFQIQRLNEEGGNFPLQTDIGQGAGCCMSDPFLNTGLGSDIGLSFD